MKKYVLLKNKKLFNVFWTTNDGSNHKGYNVLFESDSEQEMVKEWEKHQNKLG